MLATPNLDESPPSVFNPLRFGPGQPRSLDMVRDLAALYERFARRTLRPDDTVPLALDRTEGHPQFLRDGLENGFIHQPDAVIFKHLTADMGIIVDTGAHWGYMAMSILNSGTTCPLLSIEAVSSNAVCLNTIRDVSPHYDFVIAAASDRTKMVTFYNPVVNGTPICGINSINGNTLGKWWVPGTIEAVETYFGHTLTAATPAKFQLGVYTVVAQPLDRLLSWPTYRFATDRVAAIKIDVEGHERQVLDGAAATIQRDKPLLMVEWGSNGDVMSFMAATGYTMVQRLGDALAPLHNHGLPDNEFFVHTSRMQEYREIGLLRD